MTDIELNAINLLDYGMELENFLLQHLWTLPHASTFLGCHWKLTTLIGKSNRGQTTLLYAQKCFYKPFMFSA